MTDVTLSTGKRVALRAPTAGDLRGIKLLDVLQLDTAAHAVVIERVSDLTKPEFYALGAADALAVMTGIVGFFGATEEIQSSPPA